MGAIDDLVLLFHVLPEALLNTTLQFNRHSAFYHEARGLADLFFYTVVENRPCEMSQHRNDRTHENRRNEHRKYRIESRSRTNGDNITIPDSGHGHLQPISVL